MSRASLGLVAALAIVALAPSGRAYAQAVGNLGSDPFSLYYGYYLPHQAAIAAQPTPMDTINQNIAQRQMAAQTDRSALYDPISPYGDIDDDPLAPYSSARRGGAGARSRAQGFTYGNANEVTRGSGPAMFYGRTARYFPTLRTGRGPNQNLARVRGARGAGGMPSMPSMPGPR